MAAHCPISLQVELWFRCSRYKGLFPLSKSRWRARNKTSCFGTPYLEVVVRRWPFLHPTATQRIRSQSTYCSLPQNSAACLRLSVDAAVYAVVRPRCGGCPAVSQRSELSPITLSMCLSSTDSSGIKDRAKLLLRSCSLQSQALASNTRGSPRGSRYERDQQTLRLQPYLAVSMSFVASLGHQFRHSCHVWWDPCVSRERL